MRVVDRQTFLALPSGTLYCKGERWTWESINIKRETIEHDGVARDWFSINPAWVDALHSGDAFDRLEAMLAQGARYPMETAMGRDGLYEDDALFLIFECDDLLELRDFIDDAITVTQEKGRV